MAYIELPDGATLEGGGAEVTAVPVEQWNEVSGNGEVAVYADAADRNGILTLQRHATAGWLISCNIKPLRGVGSPCFAVHSPLVAPPVGILDFGSGETLLYPAGFLFPREETARVVDEFMDLVDYPPSAVWESGLNWDVYTGEIDEQEIRALFEK